MLEDFFALKRHPIIFPHYDNSSWHRHPKYELTPPSTRPSNKPSSKSVHHLGSPSHPSTISGPSSPKNEKLEGVLYPLLRPCKQGRPLGNQPVEIAPAVELHHKPLLPSLFQLRILIFASPAPYLRHFFWITRAKIAPKCGSAASERIEGSNLHGGKISLSRQ